MGFCELPGIIGNHSADVYKQRKKQWSGWRDLNPRPLRPERSALPSCATARNHHKKILADGEEISLQGLCRLPRVISLFLPAQASLPLGS